jgi:non-specific serine/threonine protein kinase/serine/threonine-protein kinase
VYDPAQLETVAELIFLECARTTQGGSAMIEDGPSGSDSEAPTAASPVDVAGQTIAGYRVLQKLGEGGMGVVYEAEQEEPVRRKVALKLIKPGMDTGEVLARFESERQALALMNHPSIASIFDGGATEDGRPYFAMELVHGEPLTAYCDKHRLTVRERLGLFLQVCEGVQHAHQKGIIHRDLKPSNILVTIRDDTPVPKIIDFGVAKATSQRLTERTVHTQLGQRIGTPVYMSPEQAEMTGLDIDTRTDVYSLGVVLYELLVGAQPFDPTELRKAGFEGLQRLLREVDPPKPSTRVHTLGKTSSDAAQSRQVELSILEKTLRGDLDWITMKALEKDRTRRYGSPSELAADIRRHLHHEPVVASPPSVAYRVRKFVRRHRVGVAVSTLALALLVAFAAAMTVQTVRIARGRDRADREAEKTQAVNEFLLRVVAVANPRTGKGTNATILDGVDSAAREIDELLSDDPEVRAAVQATIGSTYGELGRYEQAEDLLESALRLRREALGNQHPDVVNSLHALAWLALGRNDRRRAETLLREAVSIGRTLSREDQKGLASSLNSLAFVVMRNGDYDAAREIHEESLGLCRELFGEESDAVYVVLGSLGVLEEFAGNFETAADLNLRVLRHAEGQGRADLNVAIQIENLGWVLYEQGEFSRAESRFRESLSMMEKVFSSPNPMLASSWSGLAMTLVSLGEYEEAAELFARCLEIDPDAVTGSSQRGAQLASAYGVFLASMGRYDEAETRLLEALGDLERLCSPDDLRVQRTRAFLAELYDAWGRPEKAAEYRDPMVSTTPGHQQVR